MYRFIDSTRLAKAIAIAVVVAGLAVSAAAAGSGAAPDVFARAVARHQALPDVFERYVAIHGARPDVFERAVARHQALPDVFERYVASHPYGTSVVLGGRSLGTLDAAQTVRPIVFSQPGGFDWSDYAIGIGSGIGLILLLTGGLVAARQRRHRVQTA